MCAAERRFRCPLHAHAGRIEWSDGARTFAGAALRLRGPKPSDGLAAVVVAEEEERGGSQTRNRGAGGARHEAEDEDMSGAGRLGVVWSVEAAT